MKKNTKWRKFFFYSLLIIGFVLLVFSIGFNDDLELILLEGSGL